MSVLRGGPACHHAASWTYVYARGPGPLPNTPGTIVSASGTGVSAPTHYRHVEFGARWDTDPKPHGSAGVLVGLCTYSLRATLPSWFRYIRAPHLDIRSPIYYEFSPCSIPGRDRSLLDRRPRSGRSSSLDPFLT